MPRLLTEKPESRIGPTCGKSTPETAVQIKEISHLASQPLNLGGDARITFSPYPTSQTQRGNVLGAIRCWYPASLLRLVLRQSRSAAYHIWSARHRRTVLNYAEVRQSLPQVPYSGSRNETHFCSASIQKLCAEPPYLTFADCRLFVEGFFLAAKWYARMGTPDHNEQQSSFLPTPEAQQVYAAPSSSAIDQT